MVGGKAVRSPRLPADITELLLAHRGGRSESLDQLVPLVYNDLRRVARAQLRRLRPGDSLNTTGLVHEAYVRLIDQSRASYRDRGHFYAVCAIAMRQILVDYARRRGRQKRGGDHQVVPLDDVGDPVAIEAERVLEIDAALEKLASHDQRLSRVVECRFFAGLTEAEAAEALGVSVRTAQREWFKARAWLRAELAEALA
jgi:RNA polymerase sigma factor (TIGR02999 family)